MSAGAYDPEEEQGRRRSSHITKKEVLIVAAFIIVLAFLLQPLLARVRRQALSEQCVSNLKNIASALPVYMLDNNGRLPPVYAVSESAPVPKVFPDGTEFTWVTLISPYMGARGTFECPAASDDENVWNTGTETGANKGKTIASSYGMFGGLSAFPLDSVPTPGRQALIGETSNLGANDTFDPFPFKADGKPIPDGIVIGFDNTNFTSVDSIRKLYQQSKVATRLAFPGTGKGVFNPDGPSRHDDGVHVLMADLHMQHFRLPTLAVVDHAGKNSDPRAPWAIPY